MYSYFLIQDKPIDETTVFKDDCRYKLYHIANINYDKDLVIKKSVLRDLKIVMENK